MLLGAPSTLGAQCPESWFSDRQVRGFCVSIHSLSVLPTLPMWGPDTNQGGLDQAADKPRT